MSEAEDSNRCGEITHVEGIIFVCGMPKDHTGLPHCEFGIIRGRIHASFLFAGCPKIIRVFRIVSSESFGAGFASNLAGG